MNKKVQILLSAYNGEKYIRQQLDSLFAQSCPPASVLVRDDGSTDRTPEILAEYRERYPQLQIVRGENVGTVASFFALFRLSDPEMDYYALSDQDDVWMEDKLAAAVARLEEMELCAGKAQRGENAPIFIPLLYCGAQILTDIHLQPLESQPPVPVRKTSFGNALVQNVCTGCTAVFNQGLAGLLRKGLPEFTIMHDWWLYLTASCFGRVYYDSTPHIYYRQHGRNVFGAKTSRWQVWKYRLQALFRPRIPIREQLEAFDNMFELPSGRRRQLELVTKAHQSWKKKWKLAGEKEIFRQKKSDDLIYRGLVLLGRI